MRLYPQNLRSSSSWRSAFQKLSMHLASALLFWSPLSNAALDCKVILAEKISATRIESQTESPYQKLQVLDSLGSPSIVANIAKGTVEWQTTQANRLMQIFFLESRRSQTWLPENVSKWILSQATLIESGRNPTPLKVGTPNENLTLELKHRTTDENWIVTMKLYDIEAVLENFSRTFGITATESEVLYWMTKGKTNKDIADILEGNAATIRKHVENILRKMNAETRTAAAYMALKTESETVVTEPAQYGLSLKATEDSEVRAQIEYLQNQLKLPPRHAEILYWTALGYGTEQMGSVLGLRSLKVKLVFEERILPALKVSSKSEAIELAQKTLPALKTMFRLDVKNVSAHDGEKSIRQTQKVSVTTVEAAPTLMQFRPAETQQPPVVSETAAGNPAAVKSILSLKEKFNLSVRDAEILFWLGIRKTDAEMATLLGYASRRTLTDQVIQIYQKLGVTTRDELVKLARPLFEQEILKELERTEYSPTAFASSSHMEAIKTYEQKFKLDPLDAEILHWVTLGKKTSEVADITKQTPTIIVRRLGKIYETLGAPNRSGAIKVALASLPEKQARAVAPALYSSAALSNARILERIKLLESGLQVSSYDAEILYWAAIGKNNVQIAEILKTKNQAIADRLFVILRSLKVKSRTEAKLLVLKHLPDDFVRAVNIDSFSQAIVENPAALKFVTSLQETFKLEPTEAEVLFWTLQKETLTKILSTMSTSSLKVYAKLKSAHEKLNVKSLEEAKARISEKISEEITEPVFNSGYHPFFKSEPGSLKSVMALQKQFGLESNEAEVLYLIAKGQTNLAIAATLDMEVRTVVRRCSTLYEKLNVENREAAFTRVRKFIKSAKLEL